MMQTNLYRALRDLLPEPPLQVATVTTVHADGTGTSTIEWPGGTQQIVRGTSVAEGGFAFVRNGVIEGAAPTLELITLPIDV